MKRCRNEIFKAFKIPKINNFATFCTPLQHLKVRVVTVTSDVKNYHFWYEKIYNSEMNDENSMSKHSPASDKFFCIALRFCSALAWRVINPFISWNKKKSMKAIE